MPTPRQARVSHQLQREIALIIQRELKDPRLGFVTITTIELSNDLSHAKVAFSCLGGPEERTRSQEALNRATGFIRSLVKKRLRLKIIPAITFRYDETIAQSVSLFAKLDQLNAPRSPDV